MIDDAVRYSRALYSRALSDSVDGLDHVRYLLRLSGRDGARVPAYSNTNRHSTNELEIPASDVHVRRAPEPIVRVVGPGAVRCGQPDRQGNHPCDQ